MGHFADAASPYAGTPPENLDWATLQGHTWAYLESNLAELAREAGMLTAGENAVTRELLGFLNSGNDARPFFFGFEPHGEADGRRSTDVGALLKPGHATSIEAQTYGARKPFLLLEAKRLPADSGSPEREYLSGDRGGIERFKRGHHGGKFKLVGMLGYIQRFDAPYWRTTVNAWIDDLIATPPPDLTWDADDRLVWESVPLDHPVAILRSSPLRKIDGQRLTMRHLWVQLCPPNPAPVE